MTEQETDMGAIYETLRRELIHLLMERRSRGHFTWLTESTNHARERFFTDLTHSIADILVTAYPKKDPNAYAAALSDAETIVSSVLDRHLTSRPISTGSPPVSTSNAPINPSANDKQASSTTTSIKPSRALQNS
jgi:hypothetical protein